MNQIIKTLILFAALLYITPTYAQGIDTLATIKEIRTKYAGVEKNLSTFEHQHLTEKAAAITDVSDTGETIVLENAYDGGAADVYRGADKKLRLIKVHEQYTDAVHVQTDEYFYFADDELFFFYKITRTSAPGFDNPCHVVFEIRQERVYFKHTNVVRYLTKSAEACAEASLAEEKINHTDNTFESDLQSKGRMVTVRLAELRKSFGI